MTEPFVDSASRRPAAALVGLVDGYTGYDMGGFEPGTHQGLPSLHLTFIVSLDDPVDLVRWPGPDRAPARFGAFIGGLHESPATIRHDGRQRGIALDLTPAGARALLGVPAAPLAADVVEIEDLLGADGRELVERLREASSWERRFAVLDDVLLRVVARRAAPPPAPEVARAWSVLQATAGAVTVADLAADVGWSRRHLGERFRAELGLTPKVLARVARFQRARALLARPDRPALADIALTCGYYDQAHLNRDFRALAGRSPLAWLATEPPPVRAVPG